MLAAKCDEFLDSTTNESKCFDPIVAPCRVKGEAQEELVKKCFEEALPELMKRLDPYLKEDGFLFGDKPLMPDFFIGSLYFGMMDNPNGKFGIEDGRWAKFREENPKLVAYAARFKAAMGDYIDTRFKAPS